MIVGTVCGYDVLIVIVSSEVENAWNLSATLTLTAICLSTFTLPLPANIELKVLEVDC